MNKSKLDLIKQVAKNYNIEIKEVADGQGGIYYMKDDDNIIEYKGYQAEIKYSADDNCLYGNVINTKDTICFEIEDVKTIMKTFQEVIDDYLEMCEKVKKE